MTDDERIVQAWMRSLPNVSVVEGLREWEAHVTAIEAAAATACPMATASGSGGTAARPATAASIFATNARLQPDAERRLRHRVLLFIGGPEYSRVQHT